MITKTQFKDVCKKAAIYTIMSHPERINDNCINDEEVAAILVRFYEKIFRCGGFMRRKSVQLKRGDLTEVSFA